jgi:hypothetical protein
LIEIDKETNKSCSSYWNLEEAKLPVATADQVASIPGDVVAVGADLGGENRNRALLVDDLHFSSSSSADCGGDEWVLWVDFDDFADIVEAFAVDWNAGRGNVSEVQWKTRGNSLWLGDVVVEDLIASQDCNEAGILHRPVKVHEWRVCLEAVQRLPELQAEDEDVAVLDADDELVELLRVELDAGDRRREVQHSMLLIVILHREDFAGVVVAASRQEVFAEVDAVDVALMRFDLLQTIPLRLVH